MAARLTDAVSSVAELLEQRRLSVAFRPLDQEDIRGILLANANQLDLDWVRSEAQLAGIENERLVEFEGLVQNFYIK